MNDRITARIAEVRALLKEATPGHWDVTGDDPHTDANMRYVKVRGSIPGYKWHIADVRYAHGPGYSGKREAYADAAFIAASRELVPALLKALELAIKQRDFEIGLSKMDSESRDLQRDDYNLKIADLLDGKEGK